MNAEKWQLLNFLIGEAKMATYITRRNKVRGKESVLRRVFVALLRARVFIDFKFHKLMKNLNVFTKLWCFNDVICSLEEEELVFTLFLICKVFFFLSLKNAF